MTSLLWVDYKLPKKNPDRQGKGRELERKEEDRERGSESERKKERHGSTAPLHMKLRVIDHVPTKPGS